MRQFHGEFQKEDQLCAHLFGWFPVALRPRPELHVRVTELSRKMEIRHLYITGHSSVVKH